MWKALLKKQFLEGTAFLFTAKNGKRRSTVSLAGFGVLMVYALVTVAGMFWLMSETLCAPLVQAGMGWLYFAFMGVIATALGVVGSIFTARSKLYEAKDNDLLLSMPIPSWMILLTRMTGLYLYTLLFESFVFIPTLVRYFTVVGFGVLPALCSLIVFLIMPLGAMTLGCLLGWVITWVSSKLPVKNLIEIVFAVLFMAAYFLLYSKVNEYLGYVIAHGEAVGAKMKTLLYPFSRLGYACTGKWGALGLYLFMFIGVFALVYLLVSKTYLRLATSNRGNIRIKYKEKARKGKPVFWALVQKEGLRYWKNPMVALNCFLGSIFLVAFPVIFLFLPDAVEGFFLSFGAQGKSALFLAAFVGVMATMNGGAASCISLEGEALGLLRAFPVKTEKIVWAKAAFHGLIAALPATFATVIVCILTKAGWMGVLVWIAVLTVIAGSVLFGISINLKAPNLHWTSEIVVVKQSFSSLLGMLFGIGAIGLFVGGYFLFGKYLSAWGYLSVCTAVTAAFCLATAWWLKKIGTKIFESL